MLNIQRVDRLANRLRVTESELRHIAETAANDITELSIWEATRSKCRDVVCVGGELRKVQDRLYKCILRPALQPNQYSHGCVSGRSILTNVNAHGGNVYVYSADIANCYPSIRTDKINSLFLRKFRCAPQVANILTKLCSHRHHLALGLITSPILANEFLSTVDDRLSRLCKRNDLTYTRFVDDIVISGKFELRNSFIDKIVQRVLSDHGLHLNAKTAAGRLSDAIPITKLVVRNRKPDVHPEYLNELNRQLLDHLHLSRGEDFHGPLYSDEQLRGRINFVGWVRKSRKERLIREFAAIQWAELWKNADALGLVVAKKVIQPRDRPPPNFSNSWMVAP